MAGKNYCIALAAAAVFAAGLSGCTGTPKPEEQPEQQGPVEPVDAFNKVGEPHRARTGIGKDPDNLSTDIERLQDARRQYENDKAREAAEQRRRQAECREDKDSDKVAIEDGSDKPSVYCQQKPKQ